MSTIATATADEVALREDQRRLGLWMFLATVTMLFAAFTSAYVVRRSGSDWVRVALPPILWLNTLVLATSSVALEIANRAGRLGRWHVARAGCAAALSLGIGFLVGQVAAWRQLVDAGVSLPFSPHGSFFFMITGAHAIHVVAALVVLLWGTMATWSADRDPFTWRSQIELCRTFWHYLGVVWVCLFALVSLY
jgi:cytochrome c oxidase subunit 3